MKEEYQAFSVKQNETSFKLTQDNLKSKEDIVEGQNDTIEGQKKRNQIFEKSSNHRR